MTLFVKDVPTYNVIMILLSTVGGVIGTIVCILFLLNIATILCNKKSNTKHVALTVYILCTIYLSFTMLSCISYAFIRNNIIIGTDINNFTKSQCVIGYLFGFIVGIFSRIFLYIIFIHRIKTILNGSPYDFNPWIYKIGFFWCIVTMIIWMFIRLSMHDQYVLDYNKNTNVIFCANPMPSTYIFAIYFAPFWEFITNIVLLFMFIKGLYSLRQSIMDALNMDDTKSMKQYTFNDILEEYKQGNIKTFSPIHTVIDLHTLMKKQTVLVITALMSGIIYWILVATVEASTILITWDLIINSFCIWLMLGTSNKYWLYCTKYGFCCFCYKQRKSNKDGNKGVIRNISIEIGNDNKEKTDIEENQNDDVTNIL